MKTISLKDQKNVDIVGLIMACHLPEVEKKMWLQALPDMSEENKDELKKLLEEEVEYELNDEEKAVNEFLEKLQKPHTT